MTEDLMLKLLAAALLVLGILVLGGIVTWIVVLVVHRTRHA